MRSRRTVGHKGSKHTTGRKLLACHVADKERIHDVLAFRLVVRAIGIVGARWIVVELHTLMAQV